MSQLHVNNTIPKIVITTGEPAGIGPDITLKAVESGLYRDTEIIVIGDMDMLTNRARQLGMRLKFKEAGTSERETDAIAVVHVETIHTVTAGRPDARNSPYVINCIDQAVDFCLSGRFHGMVTAPVQKSIINDYGFMFSGHTEWIADRCGTKLPVMMLASEQMKVCLATTHLPINAVSEAITKTRLTDVLTVMHKDLTTLYHIADPVIGVCGLNPHAGEGGYLGGEEIEIIEPVIHKLQQSGMRLLGPLPADTAFIHKQLNLIDAVLAMYHDQGLPVVKHSNFGNVVNVTLGLPIIRTSVDHGTALELAGTGKADQVSLLSAIYLASWFAKNRIQR